MNDNKEFIGILLQNKRIIIRFVSCTRKIRKWKRYLTPYVSDYFVFFCSFASDWKRDKFGYAAKNERNSSSYIEIQWYIYHCGYVYRVVRQGFFSCNSAPFAESGCEIRTFPAVVFYWVRGRLSPQCNSLSCEGSEILLSFSSIPYDPYKSSMALFLSEFLYRAIREEAENRPLFAYLQHSIIGWMSVETALPISIWCSWCVFPVSWDFIRIWRIIIPAITLIYWMPASLLFVPSCILPISIPKRLPVSVNWCAWTMRQCISLAWAVRSVPVAWRLWMIITACICPTSRHWNHWRCWKNCLIN